MKDIKDEAEESIDGLKPCPFCGGSEFLHQKSGHVWCSLCTMDWVSRETWQNAFCWKEIEKKKEDLDILATNHFEDENGMLEEIRKIKLAKTNAEKQMGISMRAVDSFIQAIWEVTKAEKKK